MTLLFIRRFSHTKNPHGTLSTSRFRRVEKQRECTARPMYRLSQTPQSFAVKFYRRKEKRQLSNIAAMLPYIYFHPPMACLQINKRILERNNQHQTRANILILGNCYKALDSGSREPGSIPVSALLVGFFRTAHAEKYTHGQ